MSKQNNKSNTTNETTQNNATHCNNEGECTITNMEKYEIYKVQFERLKLAMDNKFYLEAIFIEYAIMEDRTKSILAYEGNDIIKKKNKPVFIGEKLTKIENLANPDKSVNNPDSSVENTDTSYIERYFSDDNSDDLIERIKNWKRNRDCLTHRLMNIIVTENELREYAECGKELCKELNNKTNNYKGMVKRHQPTEQGESQG